MGSKMDSNSSSLIRASSEVVTMATLANYISMTTFNGEPGRHNNELMSLSMSINPTMKSTRDKIHSNSSHRLTGYPLTVTLCLTDKWDFMDGLNIFCKHMIT